MRCPQEHTHLLYTYLSPAWWGVIESPGDNWLIKLQACVLKAVAEKWFYWEMIIFFHSKPFVTTVIGDDNGIVTEKRRHLLLRMVEKAFHSPDVPCWWEFKFQRMAINLGLDRLYIGNSRFATILVSRCFVCFLVWPILLAFNFRFPCVVNRTLSLVKLTGVLSLRRRWIFSSHSK